MGFERNDLLKWFGLNGMFGNLSKYVVRAQGAPAHNTNKNTVTENTTAADL